MRDLQLQNLTTVVSPSILLISPSATGNRLLKIQGTQLICQGDQKVMST